MEALQALTSHPVAFTGLVFVLGLLVGSFLNVVIHRFPVMMERSWKAQCAEMLGQDDPPREDRFDLVVPRSRCPDCGHRITAVENIPVLSYLMLRGRCSACGVRISPRYPVVELLTGVLSAAVAMRIGAGWAVPFALLFTWALIALAGIDFDTKLLPDAITLPLLWLGLLFNLAAPDGVAFATLNDAVAGAAAGYLSLWLVYHLFRLVTGREGMGYGDFKLLAAVGAWLGWQMLPLTILLSAVVGAVLGGIALAVGGKGSRTPIPFGPFLAAAGWIAMLWGPEIVDLYLRSSGLR